MLYVQTANWSWLDSSRWCVVFPTLCETSHNRSGRSSGVHWLSSGSSHGWESWNVSSSISLSLSFIHSIILLVGWLTIKSQAPTCCNCVTMQKNKNWEWSQAAAAERDGLMLLLKLVIVVDRGPIDQPSARWDRPAKRAEPMLGNGFHSIWIIAPVRPTSESINNFFSPSSSFASMSTYLLWVLFMKMNIWCVFTLWLWARRLERWNSFYDDRHTCSQAHTMGQSSYALKCEPSAARKRSFLCSLDVRCDDDIACTIFTHFSPLQQQFFSLLL